MADQPRRIVVYVQPGCALCHQEVEFLTGHGIPFEKKDIRADPVALQEVLATGSRRTPTTVIDGDVVIGFDRRRLSEILGIAA